MARLVADIAEHLAIDPADVYAWLKLYEHDLSPEERLLSTRGEVTPERSEEIWVLLNIHGGRIIPEFYLRGRTK